MHARRVIVLAAVLCVQHSEGFYAHGMKSRLASRPAIHRFAVRLSDAAQSPDADAAQSPDADGTAPAAPKPPLRLDATTKLQLGTLLFCGMLTTMAVGMVTPLLPAYAERIGLSSRGVGWIIAMPSIARVVLNLPMGPLVDRGRRIPLIAGCVLEGIGALGTALASSLSTMLPARLLVGMGSSAATTASQAYTMDVVDKYPDHRGVLLGSMQAAYTLAWAAGPAVGGLVAVRSGSAALPFFLIGGTLLLSAPLYALLLPETRGTPVGDASEERDDSVGSVLRTFSQLASRREQRALLAMRFGLITGWSAWLTVLPLQAAASWGATAADLGTMFSVIALLGFVSAPIGGWLADRWGRLPVILSGATVSALAIGALPWALSKQAFYALMAVWDIGEAMLIAAATALAADVTSAELRGTQTSMLNQMQDLTFSIMPVALGGLAAARGNALALRTASACMLVSCAAFGLWAEEQAGPAL